MEPNDDSEIKLESIVPEECGVPKNDGTRGSALYLVVIKLSKVPPSGWSRLFVHAWDNPTSYTLGHRPRIASVHGDRIHLDGTTLEEVRDTHKRTLVQSVAFANEAYFAEMAAAARARDEQVAREERERDRIKQLSSEVQF